MFSVERNRPEGSFDFRVSLSFGRGESGFQGPVLIAFILLQGRLNLVTAEKVKEGIAEVKDFKTIW